MFVSWPSPPDCIDEDDVGGTWGCLDVGGGIGGLLAGIGPWVATTEGVVDDDVEDEATSIEVDIKDDGTFIIIIGFVEEVGDGIGGWCWGWGWYRGEIVDDGGGGDVPRGYIEGDNVDG